MSLCGTSNNKRQLLFCCCSCSVKITPPACTSKDNYGLGRWIQVWWKRLYQSCNVSRFSNWDTWYHKRFTDRLFLNWVNTFQCLQWIHFLDAVQHWTHLLIGISKLTLKLFQMNTISCQESWPFLTVSRWVVCKKLEYWKNIIFFMIFNRNRRFQRTPSTALAQKRI